MIDFSHANSEKKHERQMDVARDVGAQIAGGGKCVFGVMVESHLNAGNQKFTPGRDDPAALEYGKSITDACIGWGDSVDVLGILADAVKRRRGIRDSNAG
jgi:3-deoxy-7-phosphoheptulonate synthase